MQIHLDSPSRGYLPGALVKGEVELDPSMDGECGTLSIIFSGRSMVELNAWSVGPGDYGTSTAFLFRSTRTLYVGAWPCFAMPLGGWPFVFAFPYQPHRGQSWHAWTSASVESGHPKQWSAVHASRSLPRSFSYDGDTVCSALVEYRLEAKWMTSVREQQRDSVLLPFDTYRWDADPGVAPVVKTEHFSLRSPLVQREEPEKCPLTFRDKVLQGATPLIELGLIYISEKSTASEIPTVFLRSITVELEHSTAVRTLRRAASHSFVSTLDSKKSLEIALRGSGTVDIADILELNTEDIPYDLYTFNVSQKNSLIVRFGVECLGQRFEFQHTSRLAVLSPFYEESPPSF
ncbi:hypothetical protein NUU61_004052 [Penicillium alfredii]|uniref:Uncharacterized protein n=1 Tax=Penicillium alfredii TaxID=1506179 RepID=A0A9W9FKG7_9EURO|nr:uncharacterized protein NUU61_004052 [Penicillium alfredii]KAJ5101830.1 hypothetical protein NUU61_004052 [Penicillium alfredii]